MNRHSPRCCCCCCNSKNEKYHLACKKISIACKTLQKCIKIFQLFLSAFWVLLLFYRQLIFCRLDANMWTFGVVIFILFYAIEREFTFMFHFQKCSLLFFGTSLKFKHFELILFLFCFKVFKRNNVENETWWKITLKLKLFFCFLN